MLRENKMQNEKTSSLYRKCLNRNFILVFTLIEKIMILIINYCWISFALIIIRTINSINDVRNLQS